jgi:hypothetical protein
MAASDHAIKAFVVVPGASEMSPEAPGLIAYVGRSRSAT